MSIIGHNNNSNNNKKSKMGVKKMASIPKYSSKETPKLDLTPSPKNTLVSGIVDQLIQSGYKGDLMSSAGMSYAQDPNPYVEDKNLNELSEDIVVDDIDFDKQSELKKTKKKQASAKQKQAEYFEERHKVSQEQVQRVSKQARKLYGQIDEFISLLRDAADKSYDNQRLNYKLENLRRICVGFVRNMEQQIPNYATSLFVEAEDKANDQ